MNAIILAGGKSSRTKTYKAFIELGKKKLIERVIERLKNSFKEIIIISDRVDRYKDYGLKIYVDKILHKGPLMGLYTGLLNSNSDYSFVVGCDQPFIDNRLIEYMKGKINNADIVVPKVADKLQMLFAIYRRNCLEKIEEMIKKNIFSLWRLSHQVNTVYIDEEEVRSICDLEKSFFNLNKEEDIEKALRWLSDEDRNC